MSVFVSVENTPNPLVRKFSTGEPIAAEPFDALARIADFPFLSVIVEAGAVSVFAGQDHLAVGVPDPGDWKALMPAIRQAVTSVADRLSSLGTVLPADAAEPGDIDPVVARINDLLYTRIRPAVAHDGGDVRFRSFEDGVLTLEMAGACSGCPSSAATLKQGILTMMRHFVPEVRDVVSA
jgi:Fe-S cluster biogenesis protein NfuA